MTLNDQQPSMQCGASTTVGHENLRSDVGLRQATPQSGVLLTSRPPAATHVLAGYNTTPQGETLLGGFIAGYREARPDHGLFTLLFVLSIFSVGVDLTPIDVGARTGTVGTVAPAMIEAVRRGGAMKADLSDAWDHWAWADVPLDEARHRLGIADKQQHGPGTTD